MKIGTHVQSPVLVGNRRPRWGTWLFFASWTAAVLVVLWWLGADQSGRVDFLIELDRSESGSWAEEVRRWLSGHVEVYWAYAWVLLAPYVIWLSLRFALDRKRLLWRLAMHLTLGAGFVLASQAFTQHLQSLRPSSIFITGEDVVRQEGSDATNGSTTVVLMRRGQTGSK